MFRLLLHEKSFRSIVSPPKSSIFRKSSNYRFYALKSTILGDFKGFSGSQWSVADKLDISSCTNDTALIGDEELEELGKLACLNIPKENFEKVRFSLANQLSILKRIDAFETDVEPLYTTLERFEIMTRADEVSLPEFSDDTNGVNQALNPEELPILKNASVKDSPFFVVPRKNNFE